MSSHPGKPKDELKWLLNLLFCLSEGERERSSIHHASDEAHAASNSSADTSVKVEELWFTVRFIKNLETKAVSDRYVLIRGSGT